MPFRKHAPVEDTRDQESRGVLAVKYNMPAALHSPETRTNILATSTQFRFAGQRTATGFQIVNVADGLAFAPSLKGIGAYAQ
jgi:hypothetical protein